MEPYPIEEVIAGSKQAEIDLREERLQEFDSAEEMPEFLHNDSLNTSVNKVISERLRRRKTYGSFPQN